MCAHRHSVLNLHIFPSSLACQDPRVAVVLREMHQLQKQLEVLKQCQSLQVELNKMIEVKKLRDENIAKTQIQPCTVAHPPMECCSMSTIYVYMFLLCMAIKMIFGNDIHVKKHVR